MKKIFSLAAIVISSFILIFTPLYVYAKLKSDGLEGIPKDSYKGIIELWHIDIFEGGSGSRADFLKNRAIEFEKNNKGVLISVKKYTKQEAEEKVIAGEFPDMLSYGLGVDFALERAVELKKIGLSGKYISGGILDGKQYAVPWCMGGYVLIGNEKYLNGGAIADNLQSLTVSKSAYNQPLIALMLSGLNAGEITVKEPLDAYVDFIAGRTKVVLGTQRDIIRLEHKGLSLKYQALEGFSDLMQYISITSQDNSKIVFCERFIEYLLSEKSQKKLIAVDMLPVTGIKLYQDVNMKVLEDSILKPFKTISAFTSADILNEMNETALKAVKGSDEDRKIIENLLQ